MRKRILITIILLLALPAGAMAGDGKGGQPANFRNLALGGRPAAMGGAFTAVAEGGIGFLYNAAGAAQTDQHMVGFSYRIMELERRLGHVSVGLPAQGEAMLAFNWVHAGTGDLEARDDQGNIIDGQTISNSENLIGITFAKRFLPELSIGARVFYVQNTIESADAYTIGVDFGIMGIFNMSKTAVGSLFPSLRAGLVVENAGASYRWTTTDFWEDYGRDQGSSVDEDFPLNIRGGIALARIDNYLFAADFEYRTSEISRFRFGGEYTIERMLTLRAGFDDFDPTFGIGLRHTLKKMVLQIDAAYLFDKVGEGDDLLISFDLLF